jgi:DNA-binding beta-propeller fold protein YncE
MKRLIPVLILLLLPSCGVSSNNGDAPDNGVSPNIRLAFASTITGKVVILDADNLIEKSTISRGHTATIGVAVMPDQRSFYYGNQDTNELELLQVNDDYSAELIAAFPAPGPIKAVVGTSDGGLVAITSESDSVENFNDQVHFFQGSGTSGVWVSNYIIPTQQAELNDDGSLTLPCPCPRPGVALSPDGAYALVTHMHEHTAALMDPMHPEEATIIQLEPADDTNPWLGPSAFSEFSFDGNLVGIPGMQAERLYIINVANPENPSIVDFSGTLPFDVAFETDGTQAYVATVDQVPVEGQEFLNAQIPSALHVVDLSTMSIAKTIPLDVATIHVTVALGSDLLYLGSSFSRVMSYLTDGLLPYASVNLSATPMPIMEIDL